MRDKRRCKKYTQLGILSSVGTVKSYSFEYLIFYKIPKRQKIYLISHLTSQYYIFKVEGQTKLVVANISDFLIAA
jgi:hypothetical protein